MVSPALRELGRAYASILFLDRAWVGALCAAATFIYPNVGFSGLLAAFTSLLVARALNFPRRPYHVHVLNSLLVGLSIGAFFQLDAYVAALIVLAATFTVFVTFALSHALWRWLRIPALSLPFVVMAVIAALIAHSYSPLRRYDALLSMPPEWLGAPVDALFSSLGAALFTPHPLAGALLFVAMMLRSRYLALLAIGGYAVGLAIFTFVTQQADASLLMWSGFNFILCALAVGGVYMIPGWASFVLAMSASAISALLCAALMPVALTYSIPIMALPFLTVTLTLLAALPLRESVKPPWLARTPGLPEANFEQARLFTIRSGAFDSVPLLPPFFGEWRVYQGFNGKHTHKAPWQHALDFYLTDNERSFRGDGRRADDFLCFDLPVVSPAHGVVVRVQDSLSDNRPGEVDVRNNWGNFVLIRLASGLHVLLAHLRQHSVQVKEGQTVTPGAPLAHCGNSGRSPQPHLHLQVQRDAALGSPTHPFHLCSVLLRSGTTGAEYRVVNCPGEGDWIEAAAPDPMFASRVHLPVGRRMTFNLRSPHGSERRVSLDVDLTLTGQFRLGGESGAGAAFEEAHGVLAFYDRSGPRDRMLDLWLVAMGLTPLTERAQSWSDAPSIYLFPLPLLLRAALAVMRPLGGGVDSRYTRRWDAAQQRWLQSGTHVLILGPWRWTWISHAEINVDEGCVALSLHCGDEAWRATLAHSEMRGDDGVPAVATIVSDTDQPARANTHERRAG